MSEKIQKVLANAGLGSRRQLETWIEAGRVTVNGRMAKLGDRMTAHDRIRVDGREVLVEARTTQPRVIAYYKPEGEICTRSDPEQRPTVFDHLPRIRLGRWISIGRLDFNTSGLLLLTNDGELANKLMHPSSQIEREYAVRIRGEVSDAMLKRLQTGIRLEDGMARFNTLVAAGGTGSNHWYHVTVTEGRNRLVRRLWEAANCTVSRLMRVRFGPIQLPATLHRGQCVELSSEDVTVLSRASEGSKP